MLVKMTIEVIREDPYEGNVSFSVEKKSENSKVVPEGFTLGVMVCDLIQPIVPWLHGLGTLKKVINDVQKGIATWASDIEE